MIEESMKIKLANIPEDRRCEHCVHCVKDYDDYRGGDLLSCYCMVMRIDTWTNKKCADIRKRKQDEKEMHITQETRMYNKTWDDWNF